MSASNDCEGCKEPPSNLSTKSVDNELSSIFCDAKTKLQDVYTSLKSEVDKLETERTQFTSMSKLLEEVHFPDIITLDIGGMIFKTTKQTLTKDPNSMLAAMFSGRFDLKTDAGGTYFIDRDGTHFRHVLNFLRYGELLISPDVLRSIERELQCEAEFYQIQAMRDVLDKDVLYLQGSLMAISRQVTKYLKKWIPYSPDGRSIEIWDLIYQGSFHGWTATDFHHECANKSPTLLIMKSTNGSIFGGYNTAIWDAPSPGDVTRNLTRVLSYPDEDEDEDDEDDYNEDIDYPDDVTININEVGYRESEGTFLFSLKNCLDLAPIQFLPPDGKEGRVHCNNETGPTFTSHLTGVHDLYICSDPNEVKLSRCLLGNGYVIPSDLNIDNKTFLAGETPFLLQELEVFVPQMY